MLHLYINEIVAKRSAESRWPTDFLTILFHSRSKDDGLGMSSQELCDEVITLIVAGHETTASSLTWCWYLLSQNPEVYEALINEISSLGTITFEKIMSLSMPRKIINETMRLYPPGWLISRRAVNDDVLNGYNIKAGTDVLISLYALHRQPSLWNSANDFIPERFANAAVIDDFQFLPFSNGPRKCIGDSLALLEMQIHLVLVSNSIRFLMEENQIVEPEPHINLRPRSPIYMTMHSITRY